MKHIWLILFVIPLYAQPKGCHVYGKIKFVQYGEDYKVKFVQYGENLKIKYVSYGEDRSGYWKTVNYGEDYKIKIVLHNLTFSLFLKTKEEVKCLAIKYAEKSVVIIPIPKVTANPLTGPVPKINKITVASKVVMFASKTVILALL